MKSGIKLFLHKLLGFRNYLFVFSVFKIYTLKWDRKENHFSFFIRMIPPGSVILDIGANIGITAVQLARDVRSSTVIAFEPMPVNLAAMKRVIRFFGLKNIKIQEIALGDHSGEVEMVMPVISSVKMQGLSHVVHSSIPENNEGDRVKAPIMKLDEVPGLNDSSGIAAIKIDVENFEFFVLKGGEELIRTHRPVICIELWDNENRTKCFELIKSLGYRINIVNNNVLMEYDGIRATQNFIFTPVS